MLFGKDYFVIEQYNCQEKSDPCFNHSYASFNLPLFGLVFALLQYATSYCVLCIGFSTGSAESL